MRNWRKRARALLHLFPMFHFEKLFHSFWWFDTSCVELNVAQLRHPLRCPYSPSRGWRNKSNKPGNRASERAIVSFCVCVALSVSVPTQSPSVSPWRFLAAGEIEWVNGWSPRPPFPFLHVQSMFYCHYVLLMISFHYFQLDIFSVLHTFFFFQTFTQTDSFLSLFHTHFKPFLFYPF